MMNALTVIEPKDLTELKGVAMLFAESGMFNDAKQMAQAFVKIMAGREIGLGAFAAMQNVYIVNGRPAYAANAIARAIKQNPKYDYRVLELTETVCKIEFLENGERLAIEELTMETAKKAEYHKSGGKEKDTWKNFPRNMLFARCLTNGARFYTPDVFDLPIYVPDELDAEIEEPAYDPETGEVINGDYSVTIDEPEPAPQPPADTVQSVQTPSNGTSSIEVPHDSKPGAETPENAPQSATEAKSELDEHLGPRKPRAASKPKPDDGLRQYKMLLWNEAKNFDIAETLMKKAVIELPDGVNWGWKTYEYCKGTLGYRDDDHVKDTLGVASLKDWPLTLGEMLMKLVEDAPTPQLAKAS